MKIHFAQSIRRIGVPALVLLSIGSLPAHATSDGAVNQEMADRIQERLRKVPGDNSQVRVTIEDGRYVLSGFVEGIDASQDARNALRGIEGLDMSLIDARLIRQ